MTIEFTTDKIKNLTDLYIHSLEAKIAINYFILSSAIENKDLAVVESKKLEQSKLFLDLSKLYLAHAALFVLDENEYTLIIYNAITLNPDLSLDQREVVFPYNYKFIDGDSYRIITPFFRYDKKLFHFTKELIKGLKDLINHPKAFEDGIKVENLTYENEIKLERLI